MRAREIDPFSPQINTVTGAIYFSSRQYETAVKELRATVKEFPEFFNTHDLLGMALIKTGRFQEGLSELELALKLSGGNYFLREDLAIGFALSGEIKRALDELRLLDGISKEKYLSPLTFARIYAVIGKKEESWKLLDKALEDRVADLPHIAEDVVLQDALGDDDRFFQLLNKIGIRRVGREENDPAS